MKKKALTILFLLLTLVSLAALDPKTSFAQYENCGKQGELCCVDPEKDQCESYLVCRSVAIATQHCMIPCGTPGLSCCTDGPECDFGYECQYTGGGGNVCRPEPSEEDDCGLEGNTCCPANTCRTSDLYCDLNTNKCTKTPGVTASCINDHDGECMSQQACITNSGTELDRFDCYFGTVCCQGATSTVVPKISYLCEDGKSINTAIGCIPINDINGLVGFFLRWALGIGSGAAFLLIIGAAFQIITSSGDPDKLNAGKQLITAALSGLILLIFSVFLLQFLGVQILHLPGLTPTT